MIENLEIVAPLKGSRNYLHGTDICNQLFQKIKRFDSFELTIKRSTKYSLIVVSECESEKICGKIKLVFGNKVKHYILKQWSTELVQRYDYNESEVTNLCDLSISEKQISCFRVEGFTEIEQIVSMNKYLLNKCIEKTDWAFTGIKIWGQELFSCSNFVLKIQKTLGKKLAISDIYANQNFVASITFVASKL